MSDKIREVLPLCPRCGKAPLVDVVCMTEGCDEDIFTEQEWVNHCQPLSSPPTDQPSDPWEGCEGEEPPEPTQPSPVAQVIAMEICSENDSEVFVDNAAIKIQRYADAFAALKVEEAQSKWELALLAHEQTVKDLKTKDAEIARLEAQVGTLREALAVARLYLFEMAEWNKSVEQIIGKVPETGFKTAADALVLVDAALDSTAEEGEK
jgi:hypothetical protein